MRLIGLVCAAALGACTSVDQPDAPTPPNSAPPQAAAPTSTQLPAPVQGEVATRIGAEQNGQTIAVRVGERFAVQLVGVPTAGYVWAAVKTPPFLAASGEGGGPTTSAQRQPGFTGGNHWEVFYFTAGAAGAGELKLEQRRPWERNEPPSSTFAVTIEAR